MVAPALAQQGQQPFTLPPEIEEVLAAGATIAIVDAEGNTIWTSGSGIPLKEVTIPEGSKLVIYDAEGNVLYTLELTTGPNGNVMVVLPDGSLVPPGVFMKAVAPGAGTGGMQQNRGANAPDQAQQNRHGQPDEPVESQSQNQDQQQSQQQQQQQNRHGKPTDSDN